VLHWSCNRLNKGMCRVRNVSTSLDRHPAINATRSICGDVMVFLLFIFFAVASSFNSAAMGDTHPQPEENALDQLWQTSLPVPVNDNLKPCPPVFDFAECNGDGIEDLILTYRSASAEGRSAHPAMACLDGSTGKLIWANDDLHCLAVRQTKVIGHLLVYEGDTNSLHLIDIRSGKAHSESPLAPELSLLNRNNFPFLIYGQSHIWGSEVLAFQLTIHGPHPYRPVYLRAPKTSGTPTMKLALSRDFPGCFTDQLAVLIEKERFVCIDRHSGGERWSRTSIGSGVIGGSMDDRYIALYEKSGHLHLLSALTGETLWSQKLKGRLKAKSAAPCSPMIGPDLLIAHEGRGKGLSCFSLKSGERQCSIASAGPAVLMPVLQNTAFLLREHERVSFYKLGSSTPKWTHTASHGVVHLAADQVFIVSRREDRISSYNLMDGTPQWHASIPMIQGLWFPFSVPSSVQLSVARKQLLVDSKDKLIAISMKSGRETWVQEDSKGALVLPRLDYPSALVIESSGKLRFDSMNQRLANAPMDTFRWNSSSGYVAAGETSLYLLSQSKVAAYDLPIDRQGKPVFEQSPGLIGFLDRYKVILQWLDSM